MGRARLSALIIGATAIVALGLPAGALAGTYTWSMPTDFTAGASGANPDHDAYGATPWSYVDASATSGSPLTPPTAAPAAFQPLGSFSAAKWTDALDASAPFVARDPSAGQLDLEPASDRVIAVGWTSPLSHAATVSVSGTFARLGGASCLLSSAATWALVQNGSAIASGSSATISASPAVPAGGSIYLAVDYTGGTLAYNSSCDTAGVTLQVQAVDSTAPVVTLTSPAGGALVTSGLPAFAGSASNAFGASRSVTVRIYAGGAASGTPLQTLTATRSGSVYLVAAGSPLSDGTYTATAEQDDLSSPADEGFSAASTFTIKSGSSAVTIDQPPAGGNTTDPNPLLAGAAPDSSRVTVALYAGGFATGTPIGTAATTASGGRWSLRWPTPLRPGIYTAVATGTDASGHSATSGPHSFLVVLSGSSSIGIGSAVTVSRGGIASIAIACPAATGQSCAGDVLILTARSFRAVAGGPAGPLRVMFAYVNVAAGHSAVTRRRVQASVLRVLRRSRGLRVRVITNFGATSTATRSLKVTR